MERTIKTGTNVSILFIDRTNKEKVVLIDASRLGEKVKDGKNQKTLLSSSDESQIINNFNNKLAVDDFSVLVSYEEIQKKNYSLSAGQYFELKIEYVDINKNEFKKILKTHQKNIKKLLSSSKVIESEITESLDKLVFDDDKEHR